MKISKMSFGMQNGVLKFAFETHVHRVLLRVLLKIILALTNFTSNRNRIKNFLLIPQRDSAKQIPKEVQSAAKPLA